MAEGRLFEATLEGRPVTAEHATEAELALLAAPVPPDEVEDVLDRWSAVAVRNPAGPAVAGSPLCHGTEIHLLGWRVLLADTWITSRLVAMDRGLDLVATRSGRIYQLGRSDARDLCPELREHLAYALRVWGYQDVR